MSDPHMRKMKQIADNLLEIPANEQCIGHLQVAVKEFMQATIQEIEKIQKVVGIYTQ